jgi:hypothetical protein
MPRPEPVRAAETRRAVYVWLVMLMMREMFTMATAVESKASGMAGWRRI